MSNHLGDTNKMVETPRTQAVWELFATGTTLPHDVEFSTLARQLERELNEASKERDDALMMLGMYRMKSDEQKQRIKRLEEALDLVIPNCSWVHHSKKHQHKCGEPCPVVALIEKAKEAKL